MFLWLAAAGRDPSVFPDPKRFDPLRPNADAHLAFGQGLHYCLGASLGKLETRIAVQHMARRFPRLQIVDGQHVAFHAKHLFPRTTKPVGASQLTGHERRARVNQAR